MDIYLYRAHVIVGAAPPDVTGWDVESVDGDHIGKVDEATYEPDAQAGAGHAGCLVVDTGFWIFGKKRLIPAGVVTAIDREQERLVVAMTKDEVKEAPDLEEERHRDEEHGYHDAQRGYYDRFGSGASASTQTPPRAG